MGLVDNKIIKIGHFIHNVKCVSNISRYLHLGSDSIIILKTNNIENFLSKSSYLPKLDLIIIEDLSNLKTDHLLINSIHQYYTSTYLLYISPNENVDHIIGVLESGVGAYISPSYFKTFFTKHLNLSMEKKGLFLPPLIELKIALHYYPPTEGHYLSLGLSEGELQLINHLYQGLSLNEIATLNTPQKNLSTIKKMVNKLYNKIDLRNSVSII